MLKRRIRALCLTMAGFLAAAAPLLIAQQPASAADNIASKQVMITFVSFGQTYTCGLYEYADHNTDDPNQPYTEMSASLSGNAPCYLSVDIDVTLNYKDKNGVARHTTTVATTSGLRLTANGTYSAITVTAKAHYYDCDSPTCDLTVTVAPK